MATRQKNWWEHLVDYVARPFTDWLTLGAAEAGWHNYDQWRNGEQAELDSYLANAEQDPTKTQGDIAKSGINMSPETEKWLDNLIAQQNTNSARQWEEYMRDSSYLSTASQLGQLGLSSSGVLQTGGAAHNGVAAADNTKSNVAMERYQQKIGMAKQLLGMTSSMASAGVYGHALGAAKKASGVLASAASHSAYKVLSKPKKMTKKQLAHWDEMMKELEQEEQEEYGDNYNPGFGYL